MSEVFETGDLETAEHVLSGRYARMRVDRSGQWNGMRLSLATLTPAVRFDHFRFALSFAAHVNPVGALLFSTLGAGRAGYASGRGERLYQAGQVYLAAQPEDPFTITIENTDGEMAVIDPALPSQVADTAPGRTRQPVRITGYEPVSAHAARQWQHTYAYIRDTVLASPDAAAQPLVAASAAQLLAAVTLSAFPTNALTDPTIEDRHDAHPDTLRRAVAFIDEHAHTDITIADIAAAVCVTVRAVQLAFRRHLDTTPTEYLRRVRLDHAHRDLASADPAITTVTTVAYRWGFPSGSRFAAYYRQAYGVNPGHTLRN
jgi:AraC-like DNA-binding protein